MTIHWYQCNTCKLFRKKEMWKFSFSKSAMEMSEQCVKSEVFQHWWSCNLVVKLLVLVTREATYYWYSIIAQFHAQRRKAYQEFISQNYLRLGNSDIWAFFVTTEEKLKFSLDIDSGTIITVFPRKFKCSF